MENSGPWRGRGTREFGECGEEKDPGKKEETREEEEPVEDEEA
jgi:hypothetical protein